MLNDILTDLLHLALVALIGLTLALWSVNQGKLPPICGACALRMDFAQYESLGPEFMDDYLKGD